MAKVNFNKAMIGGLLTADPELKMTTSGKAYTSITVAVDRDEEAKGADKKTDFLSVVAWGEIAEFISRYFRKGSPIYIDGKIQVRPWTDKFGKRQYATEIAAEKVTRVEDTGRQEKIPLSQTRMEFPWEADLPAGVR